MGIIIIIQPVYHVCLFYVAKKKKQQNAYLK